MRSDRRVPVAIVGGGFSGTVLAAQLARRGVASLLLDGSDRAGQGVAYSTCEPAHLLNVRAEAMSAFAEEPAHFAERFEAEGGEREDFAPRRFFGGYLKDILADAVASGCVEVEHKAAVSAGREGDGWIVGLDGGDGIFADALVLANGNQEPEPMRALAETGPRYINNPWGDDARAAVQELSRTNGSALLIGTGLTMVDLALSLDAAGHRGRAVALSRRGQVPRSHADFALVPVDGDAVPKRLLPLLRWLRRRSAKVGWRAAVDSLRPHTHALWQGFSTADQRRFLRHARAWWDVHRHRIAPEVARTIARMATEGRLEIVAGRIVAARPDGDGIAVDIRRRRERDIVAERFDYVFNCTGPLGAIARTRDPLLKRLLHDGLVAPDELGMGVEVDRRSRVPGARALWALGPLTKGRFWEIVAVPDIRGQAAAVADDIAKELGRDRHA
ncbi:FAD/NAD(P)-binding protein [Sphingomonas sp.]|uniref:FAD/NAD(P)-binding protein n=1 Tax=Sphingomonas sp. TaxID=28214 RepID=UPI0025E53F6E|nr:FAD/NAD(P)-binding protein [Sphingomonas sp.]MBV9527396.1 FAD/NAD(P)-binding protein [Sphingomonas sp.]